MSSLSSSSSFSDPASRLALCLFLGSAASLGVYGVLKTVEGVVSSDRFQIIPAPKISQLSRREKEKLPYPPDALPGARDVDSPYGSFRVYEWGAEDGPRVLLIHGISTPSIALAGLASNLAEKGCRVMLFDLFGRGHSFAPSPHLHPYDSSLYTSQILLALHSSPLSWKPFTLVGYSLGGGLAADFTSYFPSSVRNLFLIAPGGLIRPSHITWKSRLLYDTKGLVPEALIEKMVGRRLWTPDADVKTMASNEEAAKVPRHWSQRKIADPELELEAEAGTTAKSAESGSETNNSRGGLRTRAVYTSSSHQLLPSNPHSTVGAVVNWQIRHHPGFVPAFISSIRNAPIHGQQDRWEKIGEYLASRAAEAEADGEKIEKEKEGSLKEVHIVLGTQDPIIVAEELVEDAEAVIGREFLRVHRFETGHEVAIENAVEIADLVAGTLGL